MVKQEKVHFYFNKADSKLCLTRICIDDTNRFEWQM